MPREDRRILFENEEVYKAIYAMCFQRQLKLPPPGQLAKITVDEGQAQIVLEMQNPLDKTEAKLEYPQDFVAAALMLYCRGCGIPLPKSAKKSVMLTEGQLMLRVQI